MLKYMLWFGSGEHCLDFTAIDYIVSVEGSHACTHIFRTLTMTGM